jgi:hypothetical protein
MEKITVTPTNGPKEVKTYRIDPVVFNKVDQACRQQHNVGVSSIIEPLLKSYFKIDETKKTSPDNNK